MVLALISVKGIITINEEPAMPRNLFSPSTSPTPAAPDRLLRFIQDAQMALVYARRQERRLPLHDSFRLTLSARTAAASSGLRPTVYLEQERSRAE
jgi:hypothetical protein